MNVYFTYYDARLVGLLQNGIRLDQNGVVLELPTCGPSTWLDRYLGRIGCAKCAKECLIDGKKTLRWFFLPYHDQSIRRAPHLDSVGRLGWASDRWPDGWTDPEYAPPASPDGR